MIEGLPERIARRIRIDPTGCWIWTGSQTNNGYGNAVWISSAIGGKIAHRAVWYFLRGPIAEGLELDHLCRVLLCVNPDHLEPVTRAENIRRSDVGGYQRRKSHCRNGHRFAGRNLLVLRNGWRVCRTCSYATQARRLERQGLPIKACLLKPIPDA